MHTNTNDTFQGYAWEQAKRSSDSPRAVGALLEPHLRADEDFRDRESKLRMAVSDAERAGDSNLIYRSQHHLGLHLEAVGTLDLAEQAMADAVAASARDNGRSDGHAAAANDHGILLARLGRHEDAIASFERAAGLAERAEQPSLAHGIQRNQAVMAWINGASTVSLGLWDSAFRIARETDDASANAQILNNVGVLRLLEGDSKEAMQLFNRSTLLAQRAGDIRGLAFTYNNLGLVFSGPSRGDHFAAIPFVEMALALLTGPVDILARLYVLNNNILVYEHAHLEPARKFRAQFAETLKSFTAAFPSRSDDIERSTYADEPYENEANGAGNDEWGISAKPVLLRACSRCGVQE